MANQAIALQARAPQQSNILSGAVQQGAQMVNMMSQQRAAERETAKAQQAMEIARAKEGREATQAEIDNAGKLIDLYTKRAGQTMNAAGYQLLLRDMDRDAPEIAEAFRANLPPERFDRNVLLQMVGSIGDNFKATFGPLETEVVQMEDGTYAVARTGGFGKPGVFELEEFQLRPEGAPAPASAPAQTPMSAPRAAAPATDAQIDEAARAIIGGAGIQDGPLRGLSPQDFDRATERANQMTAGGGARMQPVSMTTGAQMAGQPQQDLTVIVQDMMSSKQISQSNLQLMREMAGPDKDQQLAQILRSNGIQIVPDAQPGMRSAVFRPGQDAAPQMQLAQSMEGYRPTGRAARGKDPMQSPSQAPSAAGAVAEAQREPIPQAAARAEAQREPIPQAGARAAETERAKAQADADVKFMERFPSDRDSTRQMIALINNMIGDTYVKNGRLMVKKGGRQPAPGFEDVVGATWRPGFRFIPGTAAADFDAKQKQIEGGTFLEAFERLKGGGQITQVEGEKATRAISRMERSVSEVAYVEAAREFESIIRGALKRAEERYARLQGQKPAPRGGERTPASSGWGKAEVVGD